MMDELNDDGGVDTADHLKIINDIRSLETTYNETFSYIERVEYNDLLAVPRPMRSPPYTQAHRMKLLMQWIMHLEERNDSTGVSHTDLGFVTQCYLICAEDQDTLYLVREQPQTLGMDLGGLMRVWACRHISALYSWYPTKKERMNVFKQCASFLVAGLYVEGENDDPVDEKILEQQKALLLKPKIQDKDNENAFLKAIAEADEKRQKARDNLVREEKDELGIVIELEEYDQDDDGDSVNRGRLFNYRANDSESLARLCGRVFSTMAIDDYFSAAYKPHPDVTLGAYTAAAVIQLRKWFEASCLYQCDDDFQPEYAEFAFEVLLPAGARAFSHAVEDSEIGGVHMLSARDLFNDEMGNDTATALDQMTEDNLQTICKDRTHVLYDLLLLSLFSYMFYHSFSVKFVKEFVVYKGSLREKKEQLDVERKFCMPARRPLLMELQRRWTVHVDKYWVMTPPRLALR